MLPTETAPFPGSDAKLELKKRPEKKKKWKVQSIERANKIASCYGYTAAGGVSMALTALRDLESIRAPLPILQVPRFCSAESK
jgi:hypothetical protein